MCVYVCVKLRGNILAAVFRIININMSSFIFKDIEII